MSDAAIATEKKAGLWEDVLDVFFSPGELFARRENDSWVKPFLLLAAVCVVLYYVFLPANAQLWQAAMLQNAPEGADIEKMQQGAAMMRSVGGIFVPFGLLVAVAFSGVGLKIASAMLEPSASWKQSFMIATYATFVVIPQQILTAVLVLIKSRSSAVGMQDASFGVLRFVSPDAVNKAVSALLGRVDLFPIWGAVLTAIGLMAAVKMPRGRAIAAAAIAWLLVAVPGVVIALLTGAK